MPKNKHDSVVIPIHISFFRKGYNEMKLSLEDWNATINVDAKKL